MDFKIILGILSTILAIASFYPYLKDLFKGKNKPHIYSWLVWSIVQGVGTMAMIKGGAGFGAWGLAIGTFLCIFIFFLSFKYGTKNITKLDTFFLIAALLTIIVWLTQEDPLWAVIIVVLIDIMAYIPTYRKTYLEPHTESLSSYVLWVSANILAIFAIANYSLVTTLYISSLLFTDSLMIFILISRRRK